MKSSGEIVSDRKIELESAFRTYRNSVGNHVGELVSKGNFGDARRAISELENLTKGIEPEPPRSPGWNARLRR